MSDQKPELSSGRKVSAIWIIPLLALAIGIYMVIHTKMTEGPEITIIFKNAEGLEAGKTRIRYRNVDVGQVEEVALSGSLNSIHVTVKMELEARSMLREDTRFWVVRARVGTGGISGIGTILSGAYIQLDPGKGRTGRRNYVGLEVPPLTPADAPGVRLVLHSENAGSVSAGDAILYNGFKVGRIEAATLDADKKEVRYDAFVDAPYDDLVTTSSRFWNISGVAIDATTAGIRVDTGSLETILLGGVAFGTPAGLPPGEKAAAGANYKLNATYQDLQENPFQFGTYYVTEFAQSLRGLDPGAPVEYRGIQVGRVERLLIEELISEKSAAGGAAIPVLIYLEPGRLGMGDSADSVERLREAIDAGISGGIRATLQTGSLLTGKLIVALDYYADAVYQGNTEFEGYTVIPAIPSGLGRLEQQVATLLDKLNALPLETTVAEVNTVLVTLDRTLASVTSTLDSVQGILDEDSTRQLTRELNHTLAAMRNVLEQFAPGSATGQSIGNSVLELNNTLRNLETLTRTLSNSPNAVIFPTDIPADPIPEARAQ